MVIALAITGLSALPIIYPEAKDIVIPDGLNILLQGFLSIVLLGFGFYFKDRPAENAAREKLAADTEIAKKCMVAPPTQPI